MYAPEPKSLLILNYIEPFSSSLLWRLLMFKSKTFIEYQLRTFYRFSKLILTFSTFLICISLLIRRKPSRNNFKMCLTCKFILLLPPRNMLHFVPSIHDPLSFETRKPQRRSTMSPVPGCVLHSAARTRRHRKRMRIWPRTQEEESPLLAKRNEMSLD